MSRDGRNNLTPVAVIAGIGKEKEMVLAFNSHYDKSTNTQRDVILTKEKRSYRLRKRINFRSVQSFRFGDEDKAYAAFDEAEGEVLG